jgi:hypothetical protein
MDVKKLKEASEAIYSGFSWHLSPQGHEYWNEVRNNLLGLIRNEEHKKSSCKDEIAKLKSQIAELERKCC